MPNLPEGTFKIPRTGNKMLKFDGALIAEASSRRVHGQERNRWFEIGVYQAKDQWIVWVAYRTHWQGEHDHDWAEIYATPEFLIDALRKDYDPLSYLGGFPPHESFADKQARLEETIRRDYQSLITQIAEKISAEEEIT